jgi:hypothetical protein
MERNRLHDIVRFLGWAFVWRRLMLYSFVALFAVNLYVPELLNPFNATFVLIHMYEPRLADQRNKR